MGKTPDISETAPLPDPDQPGLTPGRLLVALLVGFVGCLAIWIPGPYHNLILRHPLITDSYLPTDVLFLLFVLVLIVNPLLGLARRSWMLNRRQLVLFFCMTLIACVLPSQGLLRMLPYSIAGVPARANRARQLADVYEKADLPASLFPDKIGYMEPAPVSDAMISELLPNQALPWAAWLPPLLSWGVLIFVFGLMMFGLCMIVYPQWRRNERLAFPLVEIQKSFLESPGENQLIGGVFRLRSFWIGTGLVFILFLLQGGNMYRPESIPAIPLSWDLQACFTKEPFCYLPNWIYANEIHFLFVAIVFFAPTRIGFSIWFSAVAYGIYILVARAYFPPFYAGTISDHRSGAMLVLTLVVLWLGRARWGEVTRSLWRSCRTAEARRDRKAAWMFLAGIAGMWAWFIWAGAQPGWAVLFVFIAFAITLLITRLVAETGVPFMRIYDWNASMFMEMAPIAWLRPATVFLGGVVLMVFHLGSRVNAMTLATHTLALDDAPPKQQPRRMGLLLAVLMAGLVICGAAHLYFAYHHSVSLDGEVSPIGSVYFMGSAENMMIALDRGRIPGPAYNRPAHITFGVVLTSVLSWACIAMPKWPLHPIGLLMAGTHYANKAWPSMFLGWLIKVLLLRYGGSRLYRRARGFFLGLIAGEVLAAVFWFLMAWMLAMQGKPYLYIPVQRAY